LSSFNQIDAETELEFPIREYFEITVKEVIGAEYNPARVDYIQG
jgi:hypothetical protein